MPIMLTIYLTGDSEVVQECRGRWSRRIKWRRAPESVLVSGSRFVVMTPNLPDVEGWLVECYQLDDGRQRIVLEVTPQVEAQLSEFTT